MNDKDTNIILSALAKQFDQCEKEITELKEQLSSKEWWAKYREEECDKKSETIAKLENELAEYKKAEQAAVGFSADGVCGCEIGECSIDSGDVG
jgi:hypothetical protein